MQYDVTIIGAAIIDVLAGPVSDKILTAGSTPMETIRLSFGGDALNEAVILSQLGIKTELVSKVGNDDAGKQVLSFLKDKQVGINVKVEDGLETGINIVLIDKDGERRFLTNPSGSLRKLAEEDIWKSWIRPRILSVWQVCLCHRCLIFRRWSGCLKR